MTSNRKAKTAARALAAETGRSYTHARRVDSGPAAAESAGFPRFPADAALAVDTANGTEPWDGARWNAYATACERYGELFAVRLLAIIHPGTEPAALVVDDGRHEIHYPEMDRADDDHPGFAESWAGSTVTPEQLVADARAAVAEQYPGGVPAVVDDRDDDDAPIGGCDECGLPDDECGCAGQRTYRLT